MPRPPGDQPAPVVALTSHVRGEIAELVQSLLESGKLVAANPLSLTAAANPPSLIPDVVLVDPGTSYRHARSFAMHLGGISARPALLVCIDPLAADDGNIYADAEDIVFLPCTAGELYRRIIRITARKDSGRGSRLVVGDVALDLSNYRVSVGSRVVVLAWKEVQLLRALMQQKGKVIAREALLARVWDAPPVLSTRTVDAHIRRLRSKLGPAAAAVIHTVKNVGYGVWDKA